MIGNRKNELREIADAIQLTENQLCACLTAIGEDVPGWQDAPGARATKAAEDLGWVALALDESDKLKNPAARAALDAMRTAIHVWLLTLDPRATETDLQASLDRIVDRVSDLVHDLATYESPRRAYWGPE